MDRKMLIAVDIETSCGVVGCPGHRQGNADDETGKCDHAVHHIHNQIDIIGVFDGSQYHNFKSDIRAFDDYCNANNVRCVFHGGKFDYKTLKYKGSKLPIESYVGDTQVLGACVFRKVADGWLLKYNDKRTQLNETLPKGSAKHRVGSPLSLKTMAPFYLKVEPFWETPDDHNNEDYNKLDCVYTYRLHDYLLKIAEEDETLNTYNNYVMKWQHDLIEAEYEGVLIDVPMLHTMYAEALKAQAKSEKGVHEQVTEAFASYKASKIEKLTKESIEACTKFCSTRIKDEGKIPRVEERYRSSLQTKIDKLPSEFNLNSPDQMLMILSWAGIDTTIDKKDKETNEWVEGEGTNKLVLKRAKVKGNIFASVILDYREKETECRYLKQYIEAVVVDRIYCKFNLVGTRTGRLSSAGPNLQNVKGSLRAPFIIADPEKYSIYTVDASQIEPRVIAYLTGDRQMVKLFVEGRDFHNYATKKFFPKETQGVKENDIKASHSVLRKTAKVGDLLIIYGGAENVFQNLCITREDMDIKLEHCKEMVDNFREGMLDVLVWKKKLEHNYKNGVKIKNKFGYPVMANGNKIHMTLFNTYIQGQSSQMIFHAAHMAKKDLRKKGHDVNFLILVHDEVVWRFPKGHEEICQKTVDHYMKCYKLETPHGIVPLDVEGHIADRWIK